MNGYLLIDKPKGWTSFDVVAKTRSILQREKRALHNDRSYCDEPAGGFNNGKAECRCKLKVGHTGTLDPLATGLLVILVGNYTKRAQELTKLDKTYEVELTLGATSATGDSEGDKTAVSDQKPTEQAVKTATEAFIGDIMQTPPAYSAIKVDGVRAYKLARQGKEVKMEPRPVTINSIQRISYDYPIVTFLADVSSGTYIRTLGQDMGEKLGTGAYMSNLRRTKVGKFDISNSIQIEAVNLDRLQQIT